MNMLPGYYVEIDTEKRTAEVIEVSLGFNFNSMLTEQLGGWNSEIMRINGTDIAIVWDDTAKGTYKTLKAPQTHKQMFGKVFLMRKSSNGYIIASKEIADECKKSWLPALSSLKIQDEEEKNKDE